MSQENVKLHRRAIEAFNARDVEAFIAFIDPSVEFHTEFATVSGGYHGHDGVRKFFRDLEDVWTDGIRLEPEAYFDLGEQTLVFYVLHARGGLSGAEVATPSAHVVRLRNGLAVYLKGYFHKEDALKDLSLSEDALEPVDP
jgi:hypothetical protein